MPIGNDRDMTLVTKIRELLRMLIFLCAPSHFARSRVTTFDRAIETANKKALATRFCLTDPKA